MLIILLATLQFDTTWLLDEQSAYSNTCTCSARSRSSLPFLNVKICDCSKRKSYCIVHPNATNFLCTFVANFCNSLICLPPSSNTLSNIISLNLQSFLFSNFSMQSRTAFTYSFACSVNVLTSNPFNVMLSKQVNNSNNELNDSNKPVLFLSCNNASRSDDGISS